MTEIQSVPRGYSGAHYAWHDLRDGLSRWRFAVWMATNDIKRRYRRTTIGPLWQTASFAVFIVALGVLWATLWQVNVSEFLPYVTAGMMTWLFMSATITDGCNFFLASGGLATQTTLPYSIFLYTMMLRNLFVMAHQALVFVAVILIYPPPFSANQLLLVPGLVLVTLMLAAMSLILAVFCTRFRDLPILVASVLQIVMFVTPIFWKPSLLEGKNWLTLVFLHMNVFADAISLIRDPLLGQVPSAKSYIVVAASAAVAWFLAFTVFARFRRVLVLWL